jgi:two-component system LytT family response regulator
MLKSEREFEVVGECGSGSDAVAAVRKLRPDLVFLDVQMPRLDGFGVLRQLDPDQIPGVIFVTAYDQYAVRAFEVHAVDYLLKPFKRKRFDEALIRFKSLRLGPDAVSGRLLALLEDLSRERSFLRRLLVPAAGSTLLIKVEDVDWFEAEDNYVRIHRGKESHLLRHSLRNLEEQLDPQRFLRIHRNAIVNLERVKELQPWFHRSCRVVLHNGTVIPMSRRFKQNLTEMLNAGR